MLLENHYNDICAIQISQNDATSNYLHGLSFVEVLKVSVSIERVRYRYIWRRIESIRLYVVIQTGAIIMLRGISMATPVAEKICYIHI